MSQNCEDGLQSGQEGPKTAPDPPKGAPRPPRPPQMRPKRLQDRSKSVKFARRASSFDIVERCRKKSRKQTLEPQVRNPRTKQAARRSTRRKIRRPRVRSSPYDPHEESSASQRKPQEFPNNPKRQPCCTHDELLPGTPRTRNIPARGRRCSPAGRSRSAAPSAARRVVKLKRRSLNDSRFFKSLEVRNFRRKSLGGATLRTTTADPSKGHPLFER